MANKKNRKHCGKRLAAWLLAAVLAAGCLPAAAYAEDLADDDEIIYLDFEDVQAGAYYTQAVEWAVQNRITTGLTMLRFGTRHPCTRAHIVTFLWRACGSPEPESTSSRFVDLDKDDYSYKAVLWAGEKGITKGMTETTFCGNDAVTRAQAITFLWRAAGMPAASGSFQDVPASAYYAGAVAWGAAQGITTGTTANTFSPGEFCTRAQIVTFLYREAMNSGVQA